jgi:hypothetical protein
MTSHWFAIQHDAASVDEMTKQGILQEMSKFPGYAATSPYAWDAKHGEFVDSEAANLPELNICAALKMNLFDAYPHLQHDDTMKDMETREIINVNAGECYSERYHGRAVVIVPLACDIRFISCRKSNHGTVSYPIQQVMVKDGDAVFLPYGTQYEHCWFLAAGSKGDDDDNASYAIVLSRKIG